MRQQATKRQQAKKFTQFVGMRWKLERELCCSLVQKKKQLVNISFGDCSLRNCQDKQFYLRYNRLTTYVKSIVHYIILYNVVLYRILKNV